ncbi:MAG: molybdopterin molybdotransferase MoeA [Anaerolineales bacterium]|nr:molybdopterin molybdotransferase MoeA [Anaerolineales bacterium]
MPHPEPTPPMLPVAEALAIVLGQIAPLAGESVSLPDAIGRVLAAAVVASDPLPPFAASVKDGYAVVASDGPGDYRIVGEATAGHVPNFVIRPGEVAYITTGAPMPTGADAVVMVEESELLPLQAGAPRVRIHTGVKPGADVRPIGYDVTAGETVLPAGIRLGPAEIGVIATVGRAQVQVHRQPVVAVLSTGDELADLQRPAGPGQIRDSNRYALAAAVRAVGANVVDLGIAPDDAGMLEEYVLRGLNVADVLLTSGGVSMGDRDYMKPLFRKLGEVHFERLWMKPGKPMTFATAEVAGRRRLIFGLPGNPVSSLVTFYLLGVPALRKLAGARDPHWHRVQATLAQPLALDGYRPEYHRAMLRWSQELHGGLGGVLATSTGNQASSRILSLRSANGLLELPHGEGVLPAGATVTALLIGEL